MVQQIGSYKALEVENNKGNDMSNVVNVRDKGKQKEVAVRISEPSNVIQIHDLSPFDIELERRRKGREAMAKRLEIAENEAAIAEMNNKIRFLENSKNNLLSYLRAIQMKNLMMQIKLLQGYLLLL